MSEPKPEHPAVEAYRKFGLKQGEPPEYSKTVASQGQHAAPPPAPPTYTSIHPAPSVAPPPQGPLQPPAVPGVPALFGVMNAQLSQRLAPGTSSGATMTTAGASGSGSTLGLSLGTSISSANSSTKSEMGKTHQTFIGAPPQPQQYPQVQHPIYVQHQQQPQHLQPGLQTFILQQVPVAAPPMMAVQMSSTPPAPTAPPTANPQYQPQTVLFDWGALK